MSTKSRDNLQNGKVIIPYGRSIMALVAAHSLGEKGVEVVGCDSLDFTVLSFSKHARDYFVYPDPDKDEEAFVDFMLEKVKALKPGDERPYVLMPIYTDNEIFSKHKKKFAPFIDIAAPDYEAISKLTPKDNFARTTQDLDVSVPETWLPGDEEEVKKLASEIDFPVMIKPYDLTGGRGIHKVHDPDEMLKSWQENQKHYGQKSLFQTLYEGKDYCLTALYDQGTRKASMAYKNLYRFPANESGAGILRETVPDERFRHIADDLMGPLQWNGVAEFDFLWDETDDSTPVLIEVNTRFWGGLFQSVESGIDFPWLLYKLTVEGTIEEASEAKIGARTKMPYIWLIAAIKEIMSSDAEFKEIEKQGKAALARLKDGEFLEGIRDYSVYLAAYWGEALNVSRKAEKLKETLELGKTAQNEFLNSKDPYTAFGILFIVGSLIRYGELPQEVKH